MIFHSLRRILITIRNRGSELHDLKKKNFYCKLKHVPNEELLAINQAERFQKVKGSNKYKKAPHLDVKLKVNS